LALGSISSVKALLNEDLDLSADGPTFLLGHGEEASVDSGIHRDGALFLVYEPDAFGTLGERGA